MTGEEILQKENPGDLFPNDESGCKRLYRDLIKKFHPDVYKGKNAAAIFEHITKLYNRAIEDIKNHTWVKSNYIELHTDKDKTLAVSYLYRYEFELGECFVCRNVILYILNSGHDKYMDNAVKTIKGLTFESGKMEEIKNFVPDIKAEHKLEDGRRCLVCSKAEDLYPLRAVYDYYNGKIYDKHAAWIVNRLSNLACYLQFSGLVHNGIDINSVFISPKKHAAAILGGWWYAVPKGSKMIGTTTDIYNVMPVTAKNSKTACISTDLEAIKLLGRTILGESQPRKLALDASIPKPLIQFMNDGAGTSAFDEFGKYSGALDKAYGPRVFIQMDIDDKKIYQTKKC